MYVKLLTIQNVVEKGNIVRHYPGDWVDVGNQTARMWLDEGSAWVPEDMVEPIEFGIVVRNGDPDGVKEGLPHNAKTNLVGVMEGDLEMPWEYTILYDPCLSIQRDWQILGGVRLLQDWQTAIPILSYTKLACEFGAEDDRTLTKEVIGDLRVMVYDSRLIYLRRSSDTERLLDTWRSELERGEDENLALLRALYQTVPLLLALPEDWVG